METKMETDKLQFTNCKKCGKMYLVGVGNKDIKGRGSGGENFIAFGNDELEAAKVLEREGKIPCKNCGEPCEIKDSE